MNKLEFGFKEGDLEQIIKTIARFPEVNKAVIFGSRAKGNYKNGSDVDIALWIEGDDITQKLSGILNDETLMPYTFDVLNYHTIENTDLQEHIDRIGKSIYSK